MFLRPTQAEDALLLAEGSKTPSFSSFVDDSSTEIPTDGPLSQAWE